MKKFIFCKQLKPAGTRLKLTKKSALKQIPIKERAEKIAEKKKKKKNFKKLWWMKKDTKHVAGIAACKAEKARVQKLKKLIK